MNIVVVEDVPIIRERIVDALLELPDVCVVGQADSVEAALSNIEAKQPDVVLLDISLPSHTSILNGIGVLKWVKQTYPAIQVVMLTNHAGQGYREACVQAGAFTLLDKSNEFDKLLAVIKQLSGPQRPTWSPTRSPTLSPTRPAQERQVDQTQGKLQVDEPNHAKPNTRLIIVLITLLINICRVIVRRRRRKAWNGTTGPTY